MKKILKILGGLFVGLILICGGIFTWLFSDSGNAFLRDKITQIANEKAPIGLEFTHFKLGFNSYAFAITDKQKSQIALSGDYSLLTLNTQAKINAAIKDLNLYESLIGIKLNGGLNVNGDVVKDGGKLVIKADMNAFDSNVHADVDLDDYKPKRLFLSSKEGINLESLLTFLNQPKYAKGRILLDADLDISNLNAPSGGFQIASNAISPNVSLLKQSYGLNLPKDAIKLAIDGKAQGESIIVALLANSSYLNLTSKDLKSNIKDFATNGNIGLQIQNIGVNDFALKTPLRADIALKSSKITDQEATLALNLVSNPILAHIIMPNYTPQSVQVNAKDLNLQELLAFAANYMDVKSYEMQGALNLNATADKINLANLSYALKAQLNTQINSFKYQGLQIAQNNFFNADINGDSKSLKIQAKSDLFDSNLNANALLKNNTPESVQVDLANLNLQKLSKIFAANAQGSLNAKADLKNFKDSSFDGIFEVQSQNISLDKKTLNALSGMNFKNDLSFALNGNGKFSNGDGSANLTLNGQDIQAEIKNAKINLKNENYSADFLLSTPEIAKINPLDFKLKGALTLNGDVAFANKKPNLSLHNRDFGQLDLALKDEKLVIEGAELDMKKIATFIDNDKIVKGGQANLNTNLVIKGTDAKSIVHNLNGIVDLDVRNLEIYSIDIDALARSYESANSVNLLDVGAFVLAGPLGVAATKGADVSKLGLNALVESKSVIKDFKAQFNLKNGVAKAEDVALVTGKSRIAAIGAINLNNNAFEEFAVGILDDKDCAKYSQKIKGTLSNPKIEISQTTIKTAVNLANSLLGKLKKGSKIVTEPIVGKSEECKPFYQGSVKHPSN